MMKVCEARGCQTLAYGGGRFCDTHSPRPPLPESDAIEPIKDLGRLRQLALVGDAEQEDGKTGEEIAILEVRIRKALVEAKQYDARRSYVQAKILDEALKDADAPESSWCERRLTQAIVDLRMGTRDPLEISDAHAPTTPRPKIAPAGDLAAHVFNDRSFDEMGPREAGIRAARAEVIAWWESKVIRCETCVKLIREIREADGP